MYREQLKTHKGIQSIHLLWAGIILFTLVFSVLQFIINPLIIILSIVGILGLLLMANRPFLGIMSYYFIMILRPAEIIPMLQAIGPERILAGIVVVSFSITSLIKRRSVNLVTHPLFWMVTLFYVVQVMSVFTSLEVTMTVEHLVKYTNGFIFVFLLLQIVDTPKRAQGFIQLYIVMVAYMSFSALIAYMTGNVIVAQGITRIKSLTSAAADPNSLAASMALALPFMILLLRVESRRLWQLFLALTCISMIITIILSGSRGGLIGMVVALGGIWLVSKQKPQLMVAFLLLAATMVVVMPSQYIERYSTIAKYAEGGEVDDSTKGRIDAWLAGANMFLDHPIHGVGANVFGWAHANIYSPGFTRSNLKAHNMYVQLLAELGIVGALVFGTMLFMTFKYLGRARALFRKLGDNGQWFLAVTQAFTVSLVVLLIYAMTGHSLYRLYWILAAVFTIILNRVAMRLLKEKVQGEVYV